MTIGELRKRLLSARWCLIRELREGPFERFTFLPDRKALLSGDGKLMLVFGCNPDNPHGVCLKPV